MRCRSTEAAPRDDARGAERARRRAAPRGICARAAGRSHAVAFAKAWTRALLAAAPAAPARAADRPTQRKERKGAVPGGGMRAPALLFAACAPNFMKYAGACALFARRRVAIARCGLRTPSGAHVASDDIDDSLSDFPLDMMTDDAPDDLQCNAAKVDHSKIVVAAVGDSITVGATCNTWKCGYRSSLQKLKSAPGRERYVKVLQDILGDKYDVRDCGACGHDAVRKDHGNVKHA
eukprot:gene12026-17703_t